MKYINNKKKSKSKAKSKKNTIKRQIKIHKKDTNRLWKFWLFPGGEGGGMGREG